MQTPWGKSDYKKEYGMGVTFYGTSSHGGFRVVPTMNVNMPDALRIDSGWYEEDCDWAKVALAFPAFFPKKSVDDAWDALRNWEPDAYETFSGLTIKPGESLQRDQEVHQAANKNRYQCLAAWGTHKQVPDSMVGIFAGRGGRLPNGMYPKDTAYFLVPESEYDARGNQSFVIDESKHKRVSEIK